MAVATTRRSGIGGTVTLEHDATSVYAGADVQEWSVTATQATLEANAKSDTFEVKQLGRKSAQVTISKLVAAAALFHESVLGKVLAVELVSGDEADGTTGETVFTGTIIVTQVGYQSPDGMEVENLQGETTGSFTLASGS